MTLSSELAALYVSRWDRLAKKLATASKLLGRETLTNPLLLAVPDEGAYREADVKVMYFGQETNSWHGPFMSEPASNAVSVLQDAYNEFFWTRYSYDEYGGHFWTALKKFDGAFAKAFRGKKVVATWNNVVKVGFAGKKGAPPDEICDLVMEQFDVIAEEVRILEPDIVLFLTGPCYDESIVDAFSGATFEETGERPLRQLARVLARGLPPNSFRTYHPKYLSFHEPQVYRKQIVSLVNLT